MAQIVLNENNIKNQLKQIILDLRERNGQYYRKIQNLKKYFERVKGDELITYHSSSFSFLKQSIYYKLKTNRSSRQLLNLYKNFNKLFEEIQQKITMNEKGTPIEYIIYYQDSSKKLHRIKLDKFKIVQSLIS